MLSSFILKIKRFHLYLKSKKRANAAGRMVEFTANHSHSAKNFLYEIIRFIEKKQQNVPFWNTLLLHIDTI
ncbi:MAG: hypothetical protein BAA00_13910 [Parageobacillus thermoglucosidasius]|nr:hypothetical protein [Parageobacillus thermoglucosidasius]OUM90062.1 MAG: hypothetical protein BAA00_13910 [Parageobacillus thermoglucosidasius]RDE27228.1 hypothetical protein DV714_11440 [Parageobacillus thermoglucosidasius]RDE32606.1 hypothetical protein DV713_12225 [Parageobacillus thermoglucosidasius]